MAIATAVAVLCCAASAAAAPVTAASDSLRTGWYPDEAQLTPQLLQGGDFGRAFDTPVQGQVYAQPLVSGDTLLAATEDNWIYGIDPQNGAVRWERNVGTPWNAADLECTDLTPHVGITGTPVIDPTTDTGYFFSKTYLSGSSGAALWKAHAVDLADGEEQPGFPMTISGEAQNLPGVSFDPTHQLQRPALLLMNGVVYASFGSHCDTLPYQGWIVGVSTAGEIKTMWATAPSGAAIWQAGGGLISDGEGQILFATGNSFGPTPPPSDTPSDDLGESVARVVVQPGGLLEATDFFSPADREELDERDADFGSGAPLALPSPYFGTSAVPHLLVAVGKEEVVYLLNRDDLGGFAQAAEGKNEVLQEIAIPHGLWGSMATWPGDGGYVYIPSRGTLVVLGYSTTVGGDPHLSLVATSPEKLEFGSGAPLVTSNGTAPGSGIVWISQCTKPPGCAGSTLNAYAAVPVGGAPKLLWSGPIGVSTKFARPDASEGHIYVGTRDDHILGFGAAQHALSPSAVPATATVPATAVAPSAAVPGTKLTKVTIAPATGRATFRFGSIGAGSGFQCRLIRPRTKRHTKPAAFSACSSPATYAHLVPGSYTFEVRAINPAGPDPTPLRRKFKI